MHGFVSESRKPISELSTKYSTVDMLYYREIVLTWRREGGLLEISKS